MLAHQIPVILGGGFDPSVIFAEMQGAWLEPRIGGMWQENTAVTPTTSAGQTIGLLLGLDQQQQLGPELILNEADRDFLPGYTWNLTGGTWTIANGSATNVNGANYMYLSGVLQSGKTYSIEIDATVTGSGSPYVRFGHSGTLKTIVSGVNTYIGTQSGSLFLLLYGTTNTTTVVNAISVREYLGNHAYQATAANRPTLQYVNGLPLVRCDSNDFMTVGLGAINVRRNLLTYTEQFDNAAWLKINVSVTPNAAGPDSRPVASVVTEGVGTQVQFSVSQGLAIGNGTYTYSLYVKRNTGSSRGIRLEITDGGIVNFNPDSGAVNSASNYGTGVLLSYGSESAGNGFRRYWVTFSTNTVSRLFFRLTSSASSGTIGYTGDGIQSFAIYGAQLEVSSTIGNYQKITDWTSEQFSSSGSVYFALPTGMSALHNQSIGASYSAPIQSMDLYGAVIVPSRLSDQREAQLRAYFEKLAGLR